MRLQDALHARLRKAAAAAVVETICIGLGYTAVVTADGGIGLSYTYFATKGSCHMLPDLTVHEGGPALALLDGLLEADPLIRSVGLAAANALNHEAALKLPQDPDNRALFAAAGIGRGRRVAMVGYFAPLVKKLKAAGAAIEVLDDSRGLGHRQEFYRRLGDWAEALLVTSTSILNGTCEDILAHAGPGVKTVMLGPSTPLVAEAFAHLPVDALAGTVPLDREQVLRAVRCGQGTPVIQRFSRKVMLAFRRPSPDAAG